MDESTEDSQTLFPHETGHGHHRSARERQRRGPMWGCLKGMFFLIIGVAALLFLVIGGGWWYIGSTSFADLVAKRIAFTLKARLGREVTIGSVVVDRAHLRRVVINDLRIANAPGAVNPYFATVKQVVIMGGVESFWSRKIKIGRIDIHEPSLYFEIYPADAALVHNFPHWNSGPPSRYEIVHVEVGTMYVDSGAFSFQDRRHQITALATAITSTINVTRAKDLYEGIVKSPRLNVRIQDYLPVNLDLRGGFRYTPGILELQSIAMRGRGMDVFVSGNIAPLSEGVYDLRVRSRSNAERIREIFGVNRTLQGLLEMDARLRGKAGTFTLAGGWVSPDLIADAYELKDAKGTLNVTGDRTIVDVASARYGGGTINAHYTLTQYSEPYPMNVDLNYNGISVEQLFNDWTVRDTGLRGAATGHLTYHWNKDRVLAGAGSGTARLSKNTTAFSGAKYPIPVSGSTDFALDNGVVTFRSAELDTEASHVSFTGTLRIEDVFTNLLVKIHSSDFSELDRAGYNFAHSAGKKTYTLLGLGGTGDVTGSVQGPLKTPQVVARISGTGTKYNNVLLGAADIELRYHGAKSLMTFDRAIFSEEGGRLSLTGTVEFPDRGPSPRFDLGVDATNYPVDRAMAAVNLKLNLGGGAGTGKLIVTGTPDVGKVTFLNLIVRQGDSQIRLAGDVAWEPGKGNVRFNLDIAARDFPIAGIMTFLDVGSFPVTGRLTGTLHLEGLKSALEGAGSVTVRNGTIYGEPVTLGTADITFSRGAMKATNLSLAGPAGTITGEADLNLTTNQFSYNIKSSSIDLSRVKLLDTLKGLLGGNVTLVSSGAGTFDNPELVIEATLNQATLRGLTLPPDSPPPSLYVAIRGGRLIIRGSAANLLTIEGDGAVGQDMAVDGQVRITISDIAKLLAMSPNTTGIPAEGKAVIDLRLRGKLTSLDALNIEGTVPTLDLRVSEHEFKPRAPIRFGLRSGRLEIDSFDLERDGSVFSLSGFAEITGAKRLALDVHGELEAALLQLFMKDVRADGRIAMSMAIAGTLGAPVLDGSAELQNAQVKFAGFPQLIDNINGTLVFKGDSVTIDSLRATIGGGTVTAGGSIGLRGMTPNRFGITLHGEDVSLRYFEGVTVEGDFDMRLSGDLERAVLAGDVHVTRALYFKDFNFQQSLLNVVLSRRGITPVVAASWQDRVSLRLHLDAANTLAVRNNVADVTGSAEIDLSGTLANPVVLGSVTLNEGGTVTFQKVDYRVVRGTINFQNPFRTDPYFDVTVEGRVSGGISEIETGPIDVTVNITGTLDRITPAITSEPPASDITLFSILGFGGLSQRSGIGATPNLPGTGTSLLIQSIASALGSKIFPFADSFSYDPGQLDMSLGVGRKVSFERRISPTVRALVVYNLDNAKSREVVEWAASRDWTLQLTRDESANQYRVDARFRRLYEGRWSLFGRGRGEELFPLPSMERRLQPASAAQAPSPPRPATAVAAIPAGTAVTDVQFRYDRPLVTTALSQYVAIKPGQPLAIRDVQNTIKSLFATGNFRDVRVDAARSPRGVSLTISLYLNYRVGKIVFDGIHGSEKTRTTRDLRVHSGDILSLNAVDNSAVSIQKQLERDGYIGATVDPETTFVRERNVADIAFHVIEGPQAKVGTVTLEGNLAPFTDAELIGRMKEKPGANFRLNEARSDADRMKNYVVRRDYRRADVDFLGHTYDPATKTVALRYKADVGPIVKVEITGVKRREVRKELPFGRNQEYSEDVIDRAADDIIKHYQERGYVNAAVDTESRLVGDSWVTVFNVRPGQRYRLTKVTFTGNLKESDKTLSGVVETSPSGGIRRLLATILRRPTGVTGAQLSADRDALESFYRLHGFSEATVDTPVPVPHADGTLAVDFPITEGPQTIVTDVSIEGIQHVDPKSLPRMETRPAQPLDPQAERDDILALQTFYADRGNAEVQVTPRVDISPDKTEARVTYVVAEGPEIHVGDVVVHGNTYTDSSLVLRKGELEKGDPFSYTSILEAQRNLYRLGIFNRVDVQPEQAGTSVSERNIIISVVEGRNLTASGSVGLLYDRALRVFSPRFAGALAHRNLFGTGRYLGLEGVYAPKTDQEAYLTYREPFIGRFNVPVQITVFQTDDSTRKFARIQQRGTSIEASKVAFLRTRWSVQYQYKISECIRRDDPEDLCTKVKQNVPVPTLPRTLLDIQISSVTPTFFWDRRDDIVDPHRGFFTSASVSYAFPLFSAKSHFTKEFAQGALYFPFSARTVLALSGRVGLIQPLGETEESRFVPLSERFLAGGETSHRAFGLDLLGDACRDPHEIDRGRTCIPTLVDISENPNSIRLAPLGGNGVLIMNAEYRFPLFSTVGGALFTDIGNVFGTSTIHFDDLRYGVGAGVRYLSPLGPLRLDAGFKLGRRIIGFRENGEAVREDPFAYSLTLGFPF
ncbi:MAG TPA: translocation/assembly module TamB domain-containing protein [Thermoanaerobaculia bacterium]|nr:translocation/assembly module TamB domain-containing protein [Thermoanaerobaculia bacterium]